MSSDPITPEEVAKWKRGLQDSIVLPDNWRIRCGRLIAEVERLREEGEQGTRDYLELRDHADNCQRECEEQRKRAEKAEARIAELEAGAAAMAGRVNESIELAEVSEECARESAVSMRRERTRSEKAEARIAEQDLEIARLATKVKSLERVVGQGRGELERAEERVRELERVTDDQCADLAANARWQARAERAEGALAAIGADAQEGADGEYTPYVELAVELAESRAALRKLRDAMEQLGVTISFASVAEELVMTAAIEAGQAVLSAETKGNEGGE